MAEVSTRLYETDITRPTAVWPKVTNNSRQSQTNRETLCVTADVL